MPSAVSDTNLSTRFEGDKNRITDDEHAQAWIDSDDERIVVSLASNPRLRKLRLTESEDLVDGREYIKRLRQQFERLYPVPEWANPIPRPRRPGKGRNRLSNSSVSTEADESRSDVSSNSGEISTQPLTKLMKDTINLLKPATANPLTVRRLRPEFIDIQRTKDISDAQPVRLSCKRDILSAQAYWLTIVRDNITSVPSVLSSPSFLRTILHVISSPSLPTSTFSKSSSHLFTSSPNPAVYLYIPTFVGFQDLLLWSTSLFPCLGPFVRQN